MNWFQGILYGIVSGLTEFLPISSSAHQFLMLKLFGIQHTDAVFEFLISLSILLAVLFACKSTIESVLNGNRVRSRRRKAASLDFLFVRASVIPLILCTILLMYAVHLVDSFVSIAIFCVVNGGLLFLQGRSLQGNKTAAAMSALDSWIVGCLYALSHFSGISGIAVVTTYGIIRGCERERVLNWALLLSIPALAMKTLFLFVQIFAAFSAATFFMYLTYLIAAAFAFAAGYLAITLLRFLAVRTGFSGFSFYCWGTALFSLFLYLI